MTAPAFTTNGLDIQTYNEIYAEYVNAYQAIYGAINLDSNTPDGQRVGIEAKANFDLQSFALFLYNSLDANLATGEQLRIIGKLAGILPKPATQSVWDLDVTATVAFDLPATFTIKDSKGYEWSPEESISVTASTQTITFKSVLFGAIPGAIGETFKQVTVEPNISTITATSAADVGTDEVTDAEYREIRRRSVENPSRSTLGKMFAALYDVAGVTQVEVYENSTDETDANNVKAHTIWCIVEGGTAADIAKTIIYNKSDGTGLKGAISETVTEVITILNMPLTLIHTVLFDRPTYVPLYVSADIKNKAGYSALDLELVKAKIAETTYKIRESAEATQLYAAAYQAGTTFVLTNMQLSTDDITYTDNEIVAAVNEQFTISVDNITLTEI